MDEWQEENDPISLFGVWFAEAEKGSGLRYPNTMCLSTVADDGMPEGRIVLLKSFDERGFCFFTNTESAKGRALRHEPRAALTFYWGGCGTQVRVQGVVEPVGEEEADEYFTRRPRGSQVGAWVSPQSEELASRELLDELREKKEAEFADLDSIPRPPFWSGYRVVPEYIEFWKEGSYRLHDRIVFKKRAERVWQKTRLYP